MPAEQDMTDEEIARAWARWFRDVEAFLAWCDADDPDEAPPFIE